MKIEQITELHNNYEASCKLELNPSLDIIEKVKNIITGDIQLEGLFYNYYTNKININLVNKNCFMGLSIINDNGVIKNRIIMPDRSADKDYLSIEDLEAMQTLMTFIDVYYPALLYILRGDFEIVQMYHDFNNLFRFGNFITNSKNLLDVFGEKPIKEIGTILWNTPFDEWDDRLKIGYHIGKKALRIKYITGLYKCFDTYNTFHKELKPKYKKHFHLIESQIKNNT